MPSFDRTVLNLGATARLLIIMSLALAALISGCSDPAEPIEATDELEGLYRTFGTRVPETGPVGLDERILRADIIARAILLSVSTTTPFVSDRNLGTTTAQYVSTLELRFGVYEYLKGSGGDTLLVELPLSFQDYYPSAEEAVAAAAAWLPKRDTSWDDREAIIFLQNPIGPQAQSSVSGSSKYVFTIHDLGDDEAHDSGTAYAIHDYYIDTYSIRSEKNKVWLPATSPPSSGASASAESSYYLEEPPPPGAGASGQSASVSSITLSDLKSRVQAMDDLLKQGEGVSGYRRCLEEKYADERALKTMGVEGIWLESAVSLSSGLPAGSEFQEGQIFGGAPGSQYSRFLFAGPDAHLFRNGVKDDDSDVSSYSVVSTTTRPLPRGMYEVHHTTQIWLFFPCDYVPNSYSRWNVHVRAPSATLYEAFFDPVLDTSTSAVGAGGGRGVLKPSVFIGANNATTTVSGLAWESGAVKIRLSPHTPLAGQKLEFIEMDGTTSLTLNAADAAVDAANDTLSWTVDSQPWEDGDTLMLRIRRASNRAPTFDTSTYAFTISEDAYGWQPVGTVSATDPDSGDSVQYHITGGNAAGHFQVGPDSGEIRVSYWLDYETTSAYTLTLEARDGYENGIATSTVHITVTDVAE